MIQINVRFHHFRITTIDDRNNHQTIVSPHFFLKNYITMHFNSFIMKRLKLFGEILFWGHHWFICVFVLNELNSDNIEKN